MNKQIVKTLHTLTGKVGHLQIRTEKQAETGSTLQKMLNENVKDALLSLRLAISNIEIANISAPQPPAQPADTTMHTHYEQTQEAQS